MSVENEDQCLVSEKAPRKKPLISYSREFLLSLSELEVCKKLPKGFDQAILRDFEDFSNSAPEWQRPPGSFSSQNFRRGEYESSPPTRGESNNYSRGGRWETRSSGSNDRDVDSQSDKDSDSGRRFGNQPRRPWQNPEHDGLLGSGAFPRPSGFTAGASAPKGRGNGTYQLSKTNEPYHPPRPYKAVHHARREFTDSINDETFGSSEDSGQDREEEERKRRASFEMFRKESQKERNNQIPEKSSENCDDPDILALLKESDNRLVNENNGTQDVTPPTSQSESAISAPTPAPRPLVPPGFRTSILEKNPVTKSLVPHPPAEVGSTEDKFSGISDNQGKLLAASVDPNAQRFGVQAVHTPISSIGEKMARPSDSYVSDGGVGAVRPSSESSNQLRQAYKTQQSDVVVDFVKESIPVHQILGQTGQERSGSILEKLFGGATANDDVKADDAASEVPVKSSKFSLWFGEEKKSPEDLPSGQPKDLLSLIADKGRPHLSEILDEKAPEQILPLFPFKSNEPLPGFLSSAETTVGLGIRDPPYNSTNQGVAPRVLTCEDLEQSILSEISDNSSQPQHPIQAWGSMDSKANQSKPEVNNLASQHILSLLQKGTSTNDSVPSSNLDLHSSENLHVYDGGSISTLNNSSQGSSQVHNDDKSPTLETFFGSSFMKELQSAQAPVSAQRGSIGGPLRTELSGPHGFPFSVADASFVPSDVNVFGGNEPAFEDELPRSNLMQQTKSNTTENRLLGFDVRKKESGFNFSGIGGFESRTDRAGGIQLPEEDSLLAAGDVMNPQNPVFRHSGNATNADLRSSGNVSLDIVGKLAALNAAFKDERSMALGPDGPPPFLRNPYNPAEPEISYQNMRGQQSSPPYPHLQINHGRPPMQPLDSHHARMNPQLKFMGPESIIQHEQPHHQFPGNIFHHPSHQQAPGMPTRFDPPSQNHLLQQLHPSHFPPAHLLQGHQGGAPLPPHPMNNMAGHIPEVDPLQGFQFHRQQGFGGHGIPVPAPAVGGSNHSDAFGKLMEMELRANAKQMHPLDGPGLYGEVDMRMRYR
ncbi:hypothetical protein MKW92_044963 [Papaver armeniacum]|nr:hypothetical protein MKW92_044963 [Papaver armeniacum]